MTLTNRVLLRSCFSPCKIVEACVGFLGSWFGRWWSFWKFRSHIVEVFEEEKWNRHVNCQTKNRAKTIDSPKMMFIDRIKWSSYSIELTRRTNNSIDTHRNRHWAFFFVYVDPTIDRLIKMQTNIETKKHREFYMHNDCLSFVPFSFPLLLIRKNTFTLK